MSIGTPGSKGEKVVVVGAGIIGTCVALNLQREGFQVSVLEQDTPGAGSSSANAGYIGVSSIPPLAMPGLVRNIPRMLFDPVSPLTIRWKQLFLSWHWFLRFLISSRRSRVEEIAAARASLLGWTFEPYATLLENTDLGGMIVRKGLLYAFESRKAFEGAHFANELRRRHGVKIELLDAEGLGKLEPALGPRIRHGIYAPEAGHILDPGGLTRALAELFVAGGGKISRETVKDFKARGTDPIEVVTDKDTHGADQLVIAAGAWSGRLAAKLGARVALAAERGYNVVLSDPGVQTHIPMVLMDIRVATTPLPNGLRMTTVAEYNDVDAPPDNRRAGKLFELARGYLPGLDLGGAKWGMGARPSTPDSLPVIARLPNNPRVILAFGHGHCGMALGPLTGQIVADLAQGRDPVIDLTPFRPNRPYC
jgi:D-amino-acid dehydrogenase